MRAIHRAELNCQADIADYRRAFEEFFFGSTSITWTNRPEQRFDGILKSHDRRHSILGAMRIGV